MKFEAAFEEEATRLDIDSVLTLLVNDDGIPDLSHFAELVESPRMTVEFGKPYVAELPPVAPMKGWF